MARKIISLNDYPSINKKFQNKQLVLAGGCFDIFHYGHLTYLLAAKDAGDMLVVAIESDQTIIKKKKRNPIHTQLHRAEILSHLQFISAVILLPPLYGYADYLSMVQTIQPTIIAVSQGDPKIVEKQQQAESVGAHVQIVCSLHPDISTSTIIKYASVSSN